MSHPNRDFHAQDLRPVKAAIARSTDSESARQTVRVHCPKTGIVAYMDMHTTEPLTLAHAHPLSDIDNIRKLLSLSHKAIRNLDVEILAGVLIVGLSHYELIEHHSTAVEVNRLLQLIPSNHLVRAVHMINLLTRAKAELCPRFSLDYTSFKDISVKDLDYCFTAWLKSVEVEVMGLSDLEQLMIDSVESGQSVVELFNRQIRQHLNLALVSNKLHVQAEKKAKEERKQQTERDSEFRKLRKSANEVYSVMLEAEDGLYSTKLLDFLEQLLIGDALKTLGSETRQKVIDRLESIPHSAAKDFARILRLTASAFDPFAPSDLEASTVESATAPSRPKTLAEILAAKKAEASK